MTECSKEGCSRKSVYFDGRLGTKLSACEYHKEEAKEVIAQALADTKGDSH